jgi:ABC-type glutathione transport system ATPase component
MMSPAGDTKPDPIVSVRDLEVSFQTMDRRATVKAVDGVNFDVRRGETFGIIGESGSGKTTIGRALVFLLKPTAGAILHNGIDPQELPRKAFQSHRRDYQIIFQDPNAALNPRMTIVSSVLEPLDLARAGTRAERMACAQEAMDRVGLPKEIGERYPHQLSGGQKQRVIIARALTLRPKLIVCDEVVAALDMSIRGDVLNLFAEAATRSRPNLRFHHPRPVGCFPHQRPHRGDVSRPLCRVGSDGGCFRTAAASLYAGASVGGAAAAALDHAQRPSHHSAG